MKLFLSPAKSLDFNQTIPTPEPTVAPFLKDANYLANKLSKLSANQLGELMKLSPTLADLNFERYQNWISPEKKSSDVKPAITVFTGEVYKGLNVESLSEKDLEKAQGIIRILSGLYGVLRPLDLIYPYRLEMGTKWNVTPKTKKLYAYWGEKLTNYINEETEEGELLINLASNEYFKSIQPKKLKGKLITPIFKELKGNQFKVVMMYAKHARGAMARTIIQENYTTIEELKSYNVDGYSFNESLSSENEFVFVR